MQIDCTHREDFPHSLPQFLAPDILRTCFDQRRCISACRPSQFLLSCTDVHMSRMSYVIHFLVQPGLLSTIDGRVHVRFPFRHRCIITYHAICPCSVEVAFSYTPRQQFDQCGVLVWLDKVRVPSS